MYLLNLVPKIIDSCLNIWKIKSFLRFFALADKKTASKFSNSINVKILKIMSDISAKVKAIIVDKLGVDESEVTPEASFTNDLGADSLDTVELIMEFEKEFNIAIPDDQAEKIGTVGDAINYITENAK